MKNYLQEVEDHHFHPTHIIFAPFEGTSNSDFGLLELKAHYHQHQKDSQNLMIFTEFFYQQPEMTPPSTQLSLP